MEDRLFQSNKTDAQNIIVIAEMLNKQKALIHHLKSIINELPGSIYWKNQEGFYLGHNAFAKEKMKNVHLYMDSIIGKTDYDLFPKEIADQYRKHDLEVMNNGCVSSKEEIVTLTTGETLTQLSIKRPLRDEKNNVIGIVGNTVDITYTKKIEAELRDAKEKAEKANQFKTEMVRQMEHDIRTPFGGIWVLAKMLESQESDAHKKQVLGDISSSAKELLDYCNSILEFIKTESMTEPIVEKKFNIKELIKSVVLIENVAAKSKNLKLEVDLSKKVPNILIGDSKRLYQILLNLISNAIKFTDIGFVRISAKFAKKIDQQNIVIYLIIEDSGIGMSSEIQNNIYEWSPTTDSNDFLRTKDHGLGLNIVKKLMKEIGGEIDVESEIGKGTKMICTLPLRIPLLPDNKLHLHEKKK